MFKKKYIMYCSVCGYVDGEHTKTTCPFCNHELKDSNHPLKEMKGKYPWEVKPIAEDIFQKLVKDSADFSPGAYQDRVAEEKRRTSIAAKEWRAQMTMMKKTTPNAPLTLPAVPPAAALT